MSSSLVHFLLLCSLSAVDADASTRETSVVHPSVATSDKKFFGKDGGYVWDARPKVDVFHFNHPYPVVQDSDDFDKDFVKDENSDNGSWKAQTEYDRLRHKLLKEKADVAKAMAAKTTAEDELKEALRRKKEGEEQAEKDRKAAEEKLKRGQISGTKGESEEKTKEKSIGENYAVPKAKTPGGVASPGAVKVATGETEKAMDALEDCKKQLQEAREKLKKLMEELEGLKKAQEKTQAELDAAQEHLKGLEEKQAAMDKATKQEYDEYLAAKEAYVKQQNVVAKMEEDIKVAAAKVKAIRDAEDKSGGVYPTEKSGAAKIAPLLALVAGFLLLQ